MMIRTALYLRCSSLDQLQRGFSIPDQLARLRGETRTAGESIAGEYIDQAQSGKSAAKRREYQRLLADARLGKFDRVRVESVDRGHRNDTERRQFEDELHALGVQVIYSGEPEKQAPQYRKFNRAMRGAVAELEADETSQRTYKRQLYRAKKGKWRGGTIPYGLLPDGDGWFVSDPETYPALCYIMERRAEGLGHHRIARLLNEGVALDGKEPAVPVTPGMRLYLRKPYLERQDPETGDILRLERRIPDTSWKRHTVRELCEAAVDGVYAGILQWGRTANRFDEDAEGNPKQPVIVDTGRPLVDVELLRRVQAVELAARTEKQAPRSHNQFLLAHLLYCGHCAHTMPGHTVTKYKGERHYRYRKYRCNGRSKRPGSCTLTILGADRLEQTVLEALFAETSRVAPRALIRAVNEAVERRREELTRALVTLDEQVAAETAQRDEILDALIRDKTLTPILRQAMMERAESVASKLTYRKTQQETLRAGLQTLDAQARNVGRTLQQADVDPKRWREPAVRAALQRALRLMVRRIEVSRQAPQQYTLEIWLPDAANLLVREFVGCESAWGSNPPAKLVTPPTRFEDEDGHRAASALARDCSGAPALCQRNAVRIGESWGGHSPC
jgi:DNA invertase Pin-like site-specific DNA recombinase